MRLDWTRTFFINAELQQFALFVNSSAVYIGPATGFAYTLPTSPSVSAKTGTLLTMEMVMRDYCHGVVWTSIRRSFDGRSTEDFKVTGVFLVLSIILVLVL